MSLLPNGIALTAAWIVVKSHPLAQTVKIRVGVGQDKRLVQKSKELHGINGQISVNTVESDGQPLIETTTLPLVAVSGTTTTDTPLTMLTVMGVEFGNVTTALVGAGTQVGEGVENVIITVSPAAAVVGDKVIEVGQRLQGMVRNATRVGHLQNFTTTGPVIAPIGTMTLIRLPCTDTGIDSKVPLNRTFADFIDMEQQ